MNKLEKISIITVAGLTIFGGTVFGTTGKVYNTSQGLVLRGSASKSGEPLATVANNAEVEILENLGEWYKVNANGKEGYLFAEYVKVEEATENPEEPNQEEPTETPQNNKANQDTKIYIMPVITSSVVGTIPAQTEVKVEKTLNNWSYVSYENIKGWVRTYNINQEVVKEPETTDEEEETTTETKPEEVTTTQPEIKPEENTNISFTKGYINSDSVNVRKEPNTSAEIVTTLILNTGVTIVGQTDEWYKVTYGDYLGYIYKPLISETPTATSRGNEVREANNSQNEQETVKEVEEVVEEPVQNVASSSAGDAIVAFAKQYKGYSYVWGGTTPSGGFDCSGFVYYVFNSCGYSLSRSCTVQANSGIAVSKSELQPGDIIFFNNTSNGSIGHVGIYIGGGEFIHAANSRRGVVIDTINSGYYYQYYYSARRIV